MTRIKNLLTCLLFVSLATLTACGDGGDGGDNTPELTAEEQRLVALAGTSGVTWVATSITFDGAPADGFTNFSITFRGNATSKTYTTVSGSPVFAASGTWDFNSGNLNELVFDGNSGNVFTLSSLNTVQGTVTMTVNFSSNGGAAFGTEGLYVFNLEEQ